MCTAARQQWQHSSEFTSEQQSQDCFLQCEPLVVLQAARQQPGKWGLGVGAALKRQASPEVLPIPCETSS